MNQTDTLLLGILITLFGGFVLLGGDRLVIANPEAWAYWVMVSGLLIGLGSFAITHLRARRRKTATVNE